MSVTTAQPKTRSRWLDWKPRARFLAESPEGDPSKPTEPACILAEHVRGEPTKPSNTSSVGFDGPTLATSPKIGPEPTLGADEDGGIPWAEWKAAALNRLFREQGATGQPGRITAATVRHRERQSGRR